jgi:predicted transcriptional regulator
MKTAKQEAQDLLDQIPEDASLETIVAEMQFKLDVLRGYQQFLEGRSSPHEDVMERIRGWLTSSGRTSPSATSRRSAST